MRKINLFVYKKSDLSAAFMYCGMCFAFLGSLNPWFLWPLKSLWVIISSFLITASMVFEAQADNKQFSNKYFLIPTLFFVLTNGYMCLVNQNNIMAYISLAFQMVIAAGIFKLNQVSIDKSITFIAKTMGCILLPSICFFFLYVLGFPLPSRNASFQDGLYTYSNYYFFLIDDRTLLDIFPRFSSVFLEPGQLGTTAVILLMTQYGKWKKWYNIVLLTATILTFSLAAYVLLVVIVFLGLWVQGKKVVKKVMAMIIFIGCIVTGSFFYNDGNNMLHDLILIRLEIEDGELAGNNRVTADFESEYDNLWKSSDILTGRDMDGSFGNSGYKVFIYENGLIGLFLVILFYISFFMNAKNKRVIIAAATIATLNFIVRGFPLWFCNIIPIYGLLLSNIKNEQIGNELNERTLHT